MPRRRRSGARRIVSGPDPAAVDKVAAQLARIAPHGADIDVLGPAPAPMALLRGKHRRRLLVRTSRKISLQTLLRDWLNRLGHGAGVRIAVDVDPYSFL